MVSEPRRDPVTDHLLTPQNAALVVIDYQPSQVQTVASMDRGSVTTRVGLPVGGRVPRVRGVVVCGAVLGTVIRGRGRDPLGPAGAPASDDDPLHAASSASPETTTAIAPGKGLQARSRPVDSMAMEATQLYPEVPADPGRADLEARVAQRGEGLDDAFELGHPRFEVGATRIVRNRWVQLRRFHGH